MFGRFSISRLGLFFAGWLLVVNLAVAGGDERRSTRSPDKRFEIYEAARNPDGSGTRLFLWAVGTNEPGILLCENDRWIDAKWSPDSRFLAIIDHSDGHVADLRIYHVARGKTGLALSLRFQSPEPGTYDTKWDVVSWDVKRTRATISRSALDEDGRTTLKQWVKLDREVQLE